jgi:hypothetical protein
MLAVEIGGDWVYWHTGVIDLMTINRELDRTLSIFAVGAGLIVLLGTAAGWRRVRRA